MKVAIAHLPSIRRSKLTFFSFSLLFLFLPTQLGKHFWPFFAFVYGQRIDYLSPVVYVTDLLCILCIVGNFPRFTKKQVVFLGFIFLFLSIGIFFSRQPLSGWYLLAKLVEYIFLGYSLQSFLLVTPRFYKKLASLLSIGILGETFLGLWQVLVQHSIGGIWYLLGERAFSGTTPGIANASLHGTLFLRPYATFSHPNVLAGFLLIAMTYVLGQFFLSSKKEKFEYGCTLSIGTIGLLVTLSRVAIILWVLTLSFFILTQFGKKQKRIFLGVLGAISVLFMLSPLAQRFFISSGDESVVYRLLLAKESVRLWIANPLFGVGFGNFLVNLPVLLSPSLQISILQPVHNIFLLILAETGIVGFSLFIVPWILGYRHLFTSLHAGSNGTYLRILSGIILLSQVLVLGMADHYLLTLQQGQLLITLVFAFIFSC